MIKRFTFEKINKNNPIAGVGTAGNIWMVLNALLNIDQEEDVLHVDMEKNKTINNEDEPLFGTKNAWEYYFDQINIENKMVEDLDFHKVVPRIFYNKYYSHNDKVFIRLRRLFWKNFKIKKYLSEEINDFYEKNIKEKTTLGVQIRLTDMVSNHNVKTFDDYLKRVKKILKEHTDIEQIFLATDDETIISKFSSSVDRPVIYLKDIYRATFEKKDLNPYDRCEYIRSNHSFLLGKEVLLDVFILSKCQYILKAEVSAVSQLAVLFSENTRRTFFVKNKFKYETKNYLSRLKTALKNGILK
jgi:hypothetical protein